MSVQVLGAGAFGTALALSLAQKTDVTLWSRSLSHVAEMRKARENTARLAGFRFPDTLDVTDHLPAAGTEGTVLLAVPMQQLRSFLEQAAAALSNKTLVACCKGIELRSGLGPVEVIADVMPETTAALLTGPSFASDIAQGLPTALVLACADATVGPAVQEELSTRTLRLYRTTDVVGASLGGALKNVIAIAAGVAIGAGLGESARAALMTRGFSEMQRLAAHQGARPDTLAGLSGFGDLVLTCTSTQSRNFRLGLSLGGASTLDSDVTVEGAATALAVEALAQRTGLDLPITSVVAALLEKRLDVAEAMTRLLSRSLKEE
jgi:glycerol-3-phosphate dehydrogenase (NAD(P)+)